MSNTENAPVQDRRRKNILLIYATGPVEHTIFDNIDIYKLPIGLGYLYAALRQNEFDSEILSFVNISDYQEILERIELSKPDIVGFSTFLFNNTFIDSLACMLKKRCPQVKIVLGGVHATVLHEEIMSAAPYVDAVLRGEAELSLPQLVRSGFLPAEMRGIRGLTWRGPEGLVVNPGREFPEDLDALPLPAFYGRSYSFISTSRGCPGNCTFCCTPKMSGRRVRMRSPANVVRELSELNRQDQISDFELMDDTFCADKARVRELCRLILAKKLKITWRARSRVDYADLETLRLMKAAGCLQISYGVESGAKRLRDMMNKGFGSADIIKAFKMTRAAGIASRIYIIHCGAMEDLRSVLSNIWIILRCRPASVVLYRLQLHPGTALFDAAVAQGTIQRDIWRREAIIYYPQGSNRLFNLLNLFVWSRDIKGLFGNVLLFILVAIIILLRKM